MKEYDFRFAGVPVKNMNIDEDIERVKEIRAAILAVADGFTEMPPGACLDLIPGNGVGYIVALTSQAQVRILQRKLSALAAKWKLPSPAIMDATTGARKEHCFFLVPERANPDKTGSRRPLFSPERWATIKEAIKHTLSHDVQFVYGEWAPRQSSGFVSVDHLRMFIVPWQTPATETFLKHFIQTAVFDGGKECDQWCIYLSVRGKNILVYEKPRRI